MTYPGSLPVCVECGVMVYANHACHGTRSRYQAGCRCRDCTEANTLVSRRYLKERAA